MEPYRKDPIPGRNTPCPCGSGKKAKRCCLGKIKALASIPPAYRQQVLASVILGRDSTVVAAQEPVPGTVTEAFAAVSTQETTT